MPGRAGKGEKKKWAKPELIVLVRGRPEEAVLTACKGHGVAQWTGFFNFYCASIDNCGGGCDVQASS
jgi:hypothetical protein